MGADPERSLVMLGFVGAGKSTYLAAAYHVANRHRVPGALRIIATERDLEYIESIHEEWLRCSSLSRTSGHAPTVVSVTVEASRGQVSRLHIPDVSGEALLTSLGDRRWDSRFDEAVRNADGMLLFVHPMKLIEPLTHVEIQQWGQIVDGPGAEEHATEARDNWDVRKAATDPLLVDLLEVVMSRNARRPIPTAIIVSAWDLVQTGEPGSWLRGHLPLLSQFLDNNPDAFAAKSFGVSAQGGKYPEDEEALRAMPEPADKVQVIGGEGDNRDITEPIKWLLHL